MFQRYPFRLWVKWRPSECVALTRLLSIKTTHAVGYRCLALMALKELQDEISMLCRFHIAPLLDNAILIKEKARALNAHVGSTIHRFLHPNLKKIAKFSICVTQKREGKIVLLYELLMFFWAILGDAAHTTSHLCEVWPQGLNTLGLGSATRC